MKVSVDPDMCVAYGGCIAHVREVFNMAADGVSYTDENQNVPERLADAVQSASRNCPAQAITISLS